jgi:hypothetical protein
MLKNINYNLFETISIISRSLYRYDTYIMDAAECENVLPAYVSGRTSKNSERRKCLYFLGN